MEQMRLDDFEEFKSTDETNTEVFGLTKDDIDSFAGETVTEENAEAINDLIIEELREMGVPEHRIQELETTGTDMLMDNLPTKEAEMQKPIIPLKKTTGSEGSPRPWHYPTDVKEYKDPPLPKGDKSAYMPTRRERLEAMKEGMEEYLDSEHASSQKEEQFEEQLEKIEEELETLPPHPEEETIEIEDISNEEAQDEGWKDNHERKHWKEGTATHAKFIEDSSKKQKLDAIRTRYSAGITNEDLAECGSAVRKSVARAHLPLKMHPENMNEPYDPEYFDEELQEYVNSKEEDFEDEGDEESEEEYDSEGDEY